VEEVVLSVSAYARDAIVDVATGLMTDGGTGNFAVDGVPRGATIPMAPEAVANYVLAITGRRLTRPPVLTMQAFPKAPVTALWRVQLDGPIDVLGIRSGRGRPVRDLFVGAVNGWFQPGIAVDLATSDANASDDEVQDFLWSEPRRRTSYAVTRRSDVPRDFELATVEDR
jgi:hypothetical protein